MANEAYTEVLEVVGGQFRQHGVVDRVLAKRLLVSLSSPWSHAATSSFGSPTQSPPRGSILSRIVACANTQGRLVATHGDTLVSADSRMSGLAVGERAGQVVAKAFGPFRLLLAQRLLLEHGRPVRLGSRALDIR